MIYYIIFIYYYYFSITYLLIYLFIYYSYYFNIILIYLFLFIVYQCYLLLVLLEIIYNKYSFHFINLHFNFEFLSIFYYRLSYNKLFENGMFIFK
jgi:hypothetical protein